MAMGLQVVREGEEGGGGSVTLVGNGRADARTYTHVGTWTRARTHEPARAPTHNY